MSPISCSLGEESQEHAGGSNLVSFEYASPKDVRDTRE